MPRILQANAALAREKRLAKRNGKTGSRLIIETLLLSGQQHLASTTRSREASSLRWSLANARDLVMLLCKPRSAFLYVLRGSRGISSDAAVAYGPSAANAAPSVGYRNNSWNTKPIIEHAGRRHCQVETDKASRRCTPSHRGRVPIMIGWMIDRPILWRQLQPIGGGAAGACTCTKATSSRPKPATAIRPWTTIKGNGSGCMRS